jgi:hypothetical protein
MSSPATVPLDVQQKLRDMEEKLSHFQGLEAKIDRLQLVIETLLRLDPADPTTGETMHPPPNENNLAQQEAAVPDPSSTMHQKPPPPPSTIPPNPNIAEPRLKPPAITQDEPKNHTIFDVWKTVEKKGKRNADTLSPDKSKPKRNAQRDTPTKIKERKDTPKLQKPIPIKKKKTVYNPYKKQDAHETVRANGPRNWQQRLETPAHWGAGQIMEFPYTPPSPLRQAPPAAEAKPGF